MDDAKNTPRPDVGRLLSSLKPFQRRSVDYVFDCLYGSGADATTRFLLADEVGLGKTIEAGLVLKEYLTRGLVRRFLVLTVPSLIDQWAEELESKFGLKPVTSNQAQFRNEPERFWTEESALIASIHTFKQDTHLALAARRPWDMVIVDEAQYLRNRTSRAWQAVNALPRQFVLLLTATPVQNSLEDLYNLVTLLKPGHLPSPKEFRQPTKQGVASKDSRYTPVKNKVYLTFRLDPHGIFLIC